MSARRAKTDPVLLRPRLLAWYDAHQRELPWRQRSDPWAILLSEILCQQTTVSAATPYFERLLARWPTPRALAAASLDDLLGEWAGLGYYRRARLLHATACAVAEGPGELPSTASELSKLPGLGPYTSAAVASIAFGEPVAAVDGNVERVLSRLMGLDAEVRRQPGRGQLRAFADAILDTQRPGDWNQALMELGARVCRPRAPSCASCPLAAGCVAHAQAREEAYPVLPARPAPTPLTRVAALVQRGDRILMSLRETAPNAGFLELPYVELGDAQLDASGVPLDGAEVLSRDALEKLDLELSVGEALPVHKHSITRWRISVHPYHAKLLRGRLRAPLRWWTVAADGPPLTTATRRILARSLPEAFTAEHA